MKQYRVLTQRDEFFGGKFDPPTLESALNSLAAEGWALSAVATADISTMFGGDRQEMVMILERDA